MAEALRRVGVEDRRTGWTGLWCGLSTARSFC